MGYLNDLLTGKIYKENTLICNNISVLLTKIAQIKEPFFEKDWVMAACVSIVYFLQTVIFETSSYKEQDIEINLNPLAKHKKLLNEEKTYELMKFICTHHLISFLAHEDNISFIQELNYTQRDFEEEVFKLFNFTKQNEKEYYDLKALIHRDFKLFSFTFYKMFLIKGLGNENEFDPTAVTFFTSLLTKHYLDIFFPSLNDLIEHPRN